MTVFGLSIDGDDVEAALLAHLGRWMPTHLREIQRQKDPNGTLWPDRLEPIRSYTVVHAANEKWPEDQLPMLLAYCPGLAEPPIEEGDGTVRARYQCILTAISSSVDMADTKKTARAYASAARMAILQHPALSDDPDVPFANGVSWVDERNYQITKGVEGERNLMGVSATYVIGVDQALNRDLGVPTPLEHPEEAPAPWPTVDPEKETADVGVLA